MPLLATTSDRCEDVQQAYELGANAYLVKRMSLETSQELFVAIHKFWNYCEVPVQGTTNSSEVEEGGGHPKVLGKNRSPEIPTTA